MIAFRSHLVAPSLVALGLVTAACNRRAEISPPVTATRTVSADSSTMPPSVRPVPTDLVGWEALSRQDADAALAALRTLPAPEAAARAIDVYRVLASSAPRHIADSIATLVPDARERQRIVDDLLRTALEADFEAGRSLLPHVIDADSRASALRDIGSVFAAGNLADAVAWLQEFPAGAERMAVASGILSPWAAHELPAATAWFEALTSSEQHRLLPAIIGRLVEAEPARAVRILSAMNVDEFESYAPAALAHWAKRDAAQAATWVAALEPRRRELAAAILMRELNPAAPDTARARE